MNQEQEKIFRAVNYSSLTEPQKEIINHALMVEWGLNDFLDQLIKSKASFLPVNQLLALFQSFLGITKNMEGNAK